MAGERAADAGRFIGLGKLAMVVAAFLAWPIIATAEHHGGDRFLPYDNCAPCHGAALEGAQYGSISAPSCFTCHGNRWGGPNQSPVVDPGGPYSGDVNEPLTLDASGTIDPEGHPLTFAWDFGDGSLPLPANPDPTAIHAYDAIGTYTVELTVDDGISSPTVVLFDVDITDPNAPQGDVWRVTTTADPPEAFWITIEDHGGVLVVLKDDGVNPVSLALGMEYTGVIFWMDIWMDPLGNMLWGTGDTYFGNINRTAGTMVGVVFDNAGGFATFNGTEL